MDFRLNDHQRDQNDIRTYINLKINVHALQN